jgi:hypothetical protein
MATSGPPSTYPLCSGPSRTRSHGKPTTPAAEMSKGQFDYLRGYRPRLCQ